MSSKDLALLIIVLFINLVYAVVQLILGIIKNRAATDEKRELMEVQPIKSYVVKLVVSLLCPIAAPLMFLLGTLFHKLFFHKDVDLSDVMFSKERVKTFEYADEEREMGMAPIEEAIAVSDSASLRNLMMNIVRSDEKGKLLREISLALNSEDSETAHYAASVLVDSLNEFRAFVASEHEKLRIDHPKGIGIAEKLIETMNAVLAQNVFENIEQIKYVKELDEIGEWLYHKEKSRMTGDYYEQICARMLSVKEFDLCEKWCTRQVEAFPERLSSFTSRIKLYFTRGDREQFFEVLTALKNSPEVVVDRETLDLIRTFS